MVEAKSLRIVYMGTPDFAVEPLRKLHTEGYNIVAVVTMPDKPAGRGQKLRPCPVKEYAVANNLPLLQPEKLKDEQFLTTLRDLNLDLGVVVAFKMLPEVVWAMPKYGTFNLHTSNLPDYRGAAPINWAIINGDSQTGVTTFMLDKDIDTGAILGNKRTDISESETAETLHDKLMFMGADLVVETIQNIAQGTAKPLAQSQIADSQMRPAPKIFKEDCEIDWSGDIDCIYNKIRGLSPYPAAWANIKDISFKLFEVSKEKTNHSLEFGTILSDGKKYIKIACNGGFLYLLELQMAGKKRMKVEDFLRGCRLFD